MLSRKLITRQIKKYVQPCLTLINVGECYGDSRENLSALTEKQVPHSTVRLVDKLSVVHLASSVVAIASVIAGENQRHVRLHYGQS